MPLQLQSDRIGNALVIAVSGDLVLGQSLRSVSQTIRDSGPVKGVVIDLSCCGRVDSSGLGELLLCYSFATRDDKKLLLTGVCGPVRDMMRIACVDTVLLIVAGREAALAAVKA